MDALPAIRQPSSRHFYGTNNIPAKKASETIYKTKRSQFVVCAEAELFTMSKTMLEEIWSNCNLQPCIAAAGKKPNHYFLI